MLLRLLLLITTLIRKKIIIDCTQELNKYIDKVKPVENDKNNDFFTPNLDTNLLLNDYIANL